MSETESMTAGKGRSRILLVVVGVVAVLLFGIAGWLFLGGGGPEEPSAEAVDGPIVALEPLTTTVGEASLQHARVTLAVVLTQAADPNVVEPRVALLKDALLREVARLDAGELRSAEGSDGLRERLSAEAQEIWGEQVVRRVLITELLVQ